MNRKLALLSLEQVSKSYMQGTVLTTVLKDCSLQFQQGTTHAIIGVSGSGKSTLLSLLAGLEQPTTGIVRYNNQDINRFSSDELKQYRNNIVGVMFQNPYLIKELTVQENVMIPGLIAQGDVSEMKQRADELLELLGLVDKRFQKPGVLSGGQQQRVALARALFHMPHFLIADEPTGNLDEHTGTMVIDLLLHVQQQYEVGLIISTHDPMVAQRMQYCSEVHNNQVVSLR